MAIEYRKAEESDLAAISAFVDYWLTGGGKADGVPGAGHDFFVPAGRHEGYLAKYDVLLAVLAGGIVGWAVMTKKGVLIHLLVAATFQGQGIGSEMLKRLRPKVVRSKSDQSTGDPAGFYVKHGFVKASSERVGKKKNIDIFVREGGGEGGVERRQAEGGDSAKEVPDAISGVSGVRKRSIDVIAEKVGLGPFSRRRF